MAATDSMNPTAPELAGHSQTTGTRRAAVVGVLALTCLLIRAVGLMALPIFGDEAIYLRWAQLVRGEGVSHNYWWVSLADPKPPLHDWLLAALFHLSPDPLWGGRLLSVLTAAMSVPLLVKVCQELGRLLRVPKEGLTTGGWTWGLLAAVMAIFCPFLAFHQRLATAESLFVAESLLIVWLSLRWGRLSARMPNNSPSRPQAWATAAILGSAIGCALLTRQGVSYTLCAMPPLAWLLHTRPVRQRLPLPPLAKDEAAESTPKISWLAGAAQLAAIAAIAAILWSPYLVAELRTRALDNAGISDGPGVQVPAGDLVKEVKRRVFYQENFTASESRAAIAGRNFLWVFVPGRNKDGEWDSGWLYLYLTPPVFFLCLAGLVYLAARGQWKVLALLLAWLAVTLGPVIVLGNVVFSRYVLSAVPPLLIGGAYLMADLCREAFNRLPAAAATPAVIALWAAAILWPMKDMATQATNWWDQTLTARDRYQYITGWTAGYGTRKAITDLRGWATAGPLVVITDGGWGTPADALWVYLSHSPNVSLFFTDNPRPVLVPASADAGALPDTYRLRRDKWLFSKVEDVHLPPGVPVLYLTNDPVHADPELPAEVYLQAANPNLRLEKTFNGVEINGRPAGENVALFSVARTGASPAATQANP